MKGSILMSHTLEPSEDKRSLLEKSPSSNAAVAVQAGGSKRPFFFLHGQWIPANALYCIRLSHLLGSDQPFYMLNPYTFEDSLIPPTLETIAATHIKSMRAVQPEGPYLLGGWCNGGLVAYEMARQLHADGQKVDLLVLMDPSLPVYSSNLKCRSIVTRLGTLLRRDQEKQLEWFIRLRQTLAYREYTVMALRYHYYRVRNFLGRGSPEELEKWRKGVESPVPFPKLNTLFRKADTLRQDYPSVLAWLALDYELDSQYQGKIAFFWTSMGSAEEVKIHREGWRSVEQREGVETYVLPGAHMTILKENLHTVAAQLRTCFSKAQATTLT
jgi:thioesterase domain-containing protein